MSGTVRPLEQADIAAFAQPQDAHESRRRALAERLRDQPVLALGLVFVLLYLITGSQDTAMFSAEGVRSLLLLAAPLGIFAAAQTICMLTGGIDLSITMTANLAAYVCANQAGAGQLQALTLAFGVGILVGVVNGIGVGVFKVNALIMTLGLSSVLLGITVVGMKSGGFLAGSKTVIPVVAYLGGGSLIGPIPASALVWVPLSVILIWGLRQTGLGRCIYAVGDNPVACRLGGVRVWMVLIVVYAIAGVLAVFGGLLFSGISSSLGPDQTNGYLLPAIAAVVIGGTSIMGGIGGYAGTVMGTLILTLLNRLLLTLDTSEGMRQIIYGVIVLTLAWAYVRISGQRSQ
ncbi:ABC transporter permease [Streptomyces sp. NPDC001027]|uniref:ABC transporter permease n=1 Tax=Streptomyces sp. NPDC001027 TaxID=3154771 RepID=UPI003320DDD5